MLTRPESSVLFYRISNTSKRSVVFLIRSFLLILCSSTLTAHSGQLLNSEIDLNCTQTETMLLACSYRLLSANQTTGITARADEQSLEITTSKIYPAADSVSAILFLIDTSDPGRQEVIRRNAEQIAGILEKAGPHDKAGLASFDKDMSLNVPIGGTSAEIVAAAHALKATGLTTELYRNTIKAIELVARTNADRKAIFLLSDGQAEDKAYFHADVIRMATKYGVIINTLGYPRSTALSVALQTLRRLSEETGGLYIETNNRYELPDDFMRTPFDNIDRGGQFVIDLNPLNTHRPDPPSVEINFATATGNVMAVMPVVLKALPAAVVAPVLPASTPLPAVEQVNTQSVPVNVDNSLFDTLLWYGIPIALIILILMTLLMLVLIYRRQQTSPDPVVHTVVREQNKPLAYLITQDETARCYPINSATCRIGRSRDNELSIDDSSVSRRHAEIRRTFNGQFVLYDRQSTNGVFINDHKITTQNLVEGDIIEIGDVFLRFTQKPADYTYGQNTAMLKTRAP